MNRGIWSSNFTIIGRIFSRYQLKRIKLNILDSCIKKISTQPIKKMSFPPPPLTTIDWSNIGFRHMEVNGHVEIDYNISNGGWSAPKFIKDPNLRIHGLAPGLNYGQQSFEGLKAFRTPDNEITTFRVHRNAARLIHSVSYISIPPVPVDLFVECVKIAVSLNAAYVPPHETETALFIRPLIFGSSPQITLTPPDEYKFCVYVMPVAAIHGIKPVKALILEDIDRAAPNGTGNAKLGGNYGPIIRWSEEAKKKGFFITLHLDSLTRSEIDEFSTSGFIGVKKDSENFTLVTPDSKNVLSSTTSDSTVQIARSFGWKIECRPIKYEELPSFSEVFAAGTAATLVPIRSITRKSRNDCFTYIEDNSDIPGPAYRKLLSTLKGIQSGKLKDTFGWNTKIEEVDAHKYTVE